MPISDYSVEPPIDKAIIYIMAEAVRFELTNGFPLPVFKTGAIDHSATLPLSNFLQNSVKLCFVALGRIQSSGIIV